MIDCVENGKKENVTRIFDKEGLNESLKELNNAITQYNLTNKGKELIIEYKGDTLTYSFKGFNRGTADTSNIDKLNTTYTSLLADARHKYSTALKFDKVKGYSITPIPALDYFNNSKLQIALQQKIDTLFKSNKQAIETVINGIATTYAITDTTSSSLLKQETELAKAISAAEEALKASADSEIPDYKKTLPTTFAETDSLMIVFDNSKTSALLASPCWKQLDALKKLKAKQFAIIVLRELRQGETDLQAAAPAPQVTDEKIITEYFNFVYNFYQKAQPYITRTEVQVKAETIDGSTLTPLSSQSDVDATIMTVTIETIDEEKKSLATAILPTLDRPSIFPQNSNKNLNPLIKGIHKAIFPDPKRWHSQEQGTEATQPVLQKGQGAQIIFEKWVSTNTQSPRTQALTSVYLKNQLIIVVDKVIKDYKQKSKGGDKGQSNADTLKATLLPSIKEQLSWEQAFVNVKEFVLGKHSIFYRPDSLAVQITEAIYNSPELRNEFFTITASTKISSDNDKIVERFKQLKEFISAEPKTKSPARILLETSLNAVTDALQQAPITDKKPAQDLQAKLSALNGDLKQICDMNVTALLREALAGVKADNIQPATFVAYLLCRLYNEPKAREHLFSPLQNKPSADTVNYTVSTDLALLVNSLQGKFTAAPIQNTTDLAFQIE